MWVLIESVASVLLVLIQAAKRPCFVLTFVCREFLVSGFLGVNIEVRFFFGKRSDIA